MKKVLVALDLTKHDEYILSACKDLVYDKLKYRDLSFISVVNDLVHPNREIHQILELKTPDKSLDKKIKNLIKRKTEKYFSDVSLESDIHVIEGKAYKSLIHWAEVKDVDLVVVGTKEKSEHSGITAKRLAHNLNTNMLFVPESQSSAIKHILVPVDFSDNSFDALLVATSIAKKDSSVKITVLNVIDTTPGNLFLSPYYSEYFEMISENTKNSMQKFMEPIDLPDSQLNPIILNQPLTSIASSIYNYSKNNKFDLIIMGAQNHNRFRNLLLGSVTEHLIYQNPTTSLMIIR